VARYGAGRRLEIFAKAMAYSLLNLVKVDGENMMGS